MLSWLKKKVAGPQENWVRVQQTPGSTFPFPKGAKLRPEEEVILAVPASLIGEHETIGSILLCDDDAEIALNEKAGVWCVRLRSGMTFSVARSSQVMLIGQESRPRFFHYLTPEKQTTEPAASPNGSPAEPFDKSEAGGGPPSVS